MYSYNKYKFPQIMKWLFAWIFFLAFISGNSQNYNNTIIISDLDDTYKITNSAHPFPAIWNAVFTARSFSGFPVLFNKFKSNGGKVIILTKSNQFLKPRVESLFRKDSFKPDQVIMRKGFPKDYKYRMIQEIIKSNPSSKLILIGDDVSQDPFIYERIAEQYPGKVLNIYIRVIRKKDLPKSCCGYLTAFDIAGYEVLAGREVAENAVEIANLILTNKNKSTVIPRFIRPDKTQLIYFDYSKVELFKEIKPKFENYLK
jgi:hypothetical protein